MTHVDGSAVLGELATIDFDTAVATCDGCGMTGPLASAMVYEGMGEILRCPGCTAVLARLARLGGETRLDMRGISALRWRSAG